MKEQKSGWIYYEGDSGNDSFVLLLWDSSTFCYNFFRPRWNCVTPGYLHLSKCIHRAENVAVNYFFIPFNACWCYSTSRLSLPEKRTRLPSLSTFFIKFLFPTLLQLRWTIISCNQNHNKRQNAIIFSRFFILIRS